MFSGYLNQRVGWKKRTGETGYGSPVFDAEVIIKARVEFKRSLIRGKDGEERVSEALAITNTPVSDGDELVIDGREWTVLTAAPQAGLGGRISHYEVRL